MHREKDFKNKKGKNITVVLYELCRLKLFSRLINLAEFCAAEKKFAFHNPFFTRF